MNWMAHSPMERCIRFSVCLFVFVYWSSASLGAQQSNPVAGQAVKSTSDLETRQVDLKLEDQPLSAIIEALSEQIGHGIVMDGKPLRSRGSFQLHTTAQAALDQVAAYFDCSWTLGKHGAVLMNKCFHQPGDLPQMHLKEMQRMAADLLSIWPESAGKERMSVYPFVSVPLSPGNALYRTFTSEQLKYLTNGNELTFQELSAEQKDLVRLCILTGASSNSHDVWEGLNARLAQMPYSYLQWRSWFHNQLDQQPTPFQYSLDYVWPDLQDRGYERLVMASQLLKAKGEKQK